MVDTSACIKSDLKPHNKNKCGKYWCTLLMTTHKTVQKSRELYMSHEKPLAREVEKGRSMWIATEQDIVGYMVYDHIRKHGHVCSPLYSISHTQTHTHLKHQDTQQSVWFVCVVGAVDWSDGGSNCLIVGFMETLYNACDSLFSACQEGGICDTTIAGTLLQPYALMHPPFTAPQGKMSEGDVNLFAC